MSQKEDLPEKKRYVIYDQFHWLSPDHLVMYCTGWDYALQVYNFQKAANPDKTLGLVSETQFEHIKHSLKQWNLP